MTGKHDIPADGIKPVWSAYLLSSCGSVRGKLNDQDVVTSRMRNGVHNMLFGLVAILVIGCASTPADEHVVNSSIYESIAPHNDPVACKRVTSGGTRISRNVCLPQSAWAAWTRESRDWVEEAMREQIQIPKIE